MYGFRLFFELFWGVFQSALAYRGHRETVHVQSDSRSNDFHRNVRSATITKRNSVERYCIRIECSLVVYTLPHAH